MLESSWNTMPSTWRLGQRHNPPHEIKTLPSTHPRILQALFSRPERFFFAAKMLFEVNAQPCVRFATLSRAEVTFKKRL
jgi:hypothetical protein